jgi:hypothetical protein
MQSCEHSAHFTFISVCQSRDVEGHRESLKLGKGSIPPGCQHHRDQLKKQFEQPFAHGIFASGYSTHPDVTSANAQKAATSFVRFSIKQTASRGTL